MTLSTSALFFKIETAAKGFPFPIATPAQRADIVSQVDDLLREIDEARPKEEDPVALDRLIGCAHLLIEIAESKPHVNHGPRLVAYVQSIPNFKDSEISGASASVTSESK